MEYQTNKINVGLRSLLSLHQEKLRGRCFYYSKYHEAEIDVLSFLEITQVNNTKKGSVRVG